MTKEIRMCNECDEAKAEHYDPRDARLAGPQLCTPCAIEATTEVIEELELELMDLREQCAS